MSAAVRVTVTLAAAVVLVLVCAAAGPAQAASSGPLITVYFPKDGTDYYIQGSVQYADYECVPSDAATYITSCVGDAPVGTQFDTKAAGWHTFTVRARDSAGATATTSVRY